MILDRRPVLVPLALTAAVAAGLVALGACSGGGESTSSVTAPPPVELDWRLGGDTTALDDTLRAFNLSARNFGLEDQVRFGRSNELFEHFVTMDEGLGPAYSAVGCTSCHLNNGRGAIPDLDGPAGTGPVVRLDLGLDAAGDPMPVPGFGLTLQTKGQPEGVLLVAWEDIAGEYPDGAPYRLRRPSWSVAGLPSEARVSVRTAPHLAGTGLMEAIPVAAILAAADPDDTDGDGISGQPSLVLDASGTEVLGRFGWRATAPTLRAQTANALADDLGITTSLRPDADGAPPEMSDDDLDLETFYSQGLAVPAMRDVDDPDVAAGAGWFQAVGCASCHTPTHTTGEHEIPALSHQEIWPYTDLLLHDMGDDLTDDQGAEWRTSPLWSLGLHEIVNGNTGLLHDGRARSPEEAIIWHGGEAEPARQAFMALPAAARAQLLAFLAAL